MLKKPASIMLILAIVGTVGFFAYTKISEPETTKTSSRQKQVMSVHVYDNPQRSIERIRIKAAYVVPHNTAPSPEWKELLEKELEKTKSFHEHQFSGFSQVVFDIYPDPVTLQRPLSEYQLEETVQSSFSLESSLTSVKMAEEIEQRLLRPAGNLYKADFARLEEGEYPVLGILFEGGGAWGAVIVEDETDTMSEEEIAEKYDKPVSRVHEVDIEAVDGYFIVGKTSPAYKKGVSAVFYHEFAHTLGLPDTYGLERPTAGIMGAGLYRPLEINYIDPELLKKMELETL